MTSVDSLISTSVSPLLKMKNTTLVTTLVTPRGTTTPRIAQLKEEGKGANLRHECPVIPLKFLLINMFHCNI